MTDDTTEFDMQRLAQLRTKAEHGELSAEEKEEVQAMLNDFLEGVQPLKKALVETQLNAVKNMNEALRPIMECMDESRQSR